MRARTLLVLWLLAVPASGEVIERVLAEVEGRPLMLSDVRIVEAIRGLSRAAAVEALIDERLMLHAATRLPQVSLLPEQEDQAVEALRAEHPEAASLPAAGVRRMARRQALILRYVELRFRPLVRITDAELQAAYARRYGAGADPPDFERVAADLEDALVREELDLRIEEWVAELRSSDAVRYPSDGGP